MERAELLLRRGLELADSGDLMGAIEKIEELTQSHSRYAAAQCLLGDLYLQIGSPMLAIEPLEKAVQMAPGVPLSQYLLGCALGQLAKFQRALEHLSIANRLKPNDPETLRKTLAG